MRCKAVMIDVAMSVNLEWRWHGVDCGTVEVDVEDRMGAGDALVLRADAGAGAGADGRIMLFALP